MLSRIATYIRTNITISLLCWIGVGYLLGLILFLRPVPLGRWSDLPYDIVWPLVFPNAFINALSTSTLAGMVLGSLQWFVSDAHQRAWFWHTAWVGCCASFGARAIASFITLLAIRSGPLIGPLLGSVFGAGVFAFLWYTLNAENATSPVHSIALGVGWAGAWVQVFLWAAAHYQTF